MEIILGKTSGFCGGVIRSVMESEKVLDKYSIVFCLGELVHNKQVVGNLEDRGMKVVDSLDEVPEDSHVILRAHGVPKEVYEVALKRNIDLIDLTCPKVLKVHDEAKKYEKEGYYIVVTGKSTHPEVIGIKSYCGVNSCVIENIEELDNVIDNIKMSGIEKVAIISQTTYSMKKFDMIVKKLKEELVGYNILINNTICPATEMRQKETEELASKVDAMIIIGGKNSSNTKKLYDLSSALCKNSFIIETVDDLKEDLSIFNKIGIMAGASTPKSSVDAVINMLNGNEYSIVNKC